MCNWCSRIPLNQREVILPTGRCRRHILITFGCLCLIQIRLLLDNSLVSFDQSQMSARRTKPKQLVTRSGIVLTDVKPLQVQV